MDEYEALKAEIEALRSEAAATSGLNATPYQVEHFNGS
jgi:hypothetical protein